MSAFDRVMGLKKPFSQYVGTQLRIPAGWWMAAVASKQEDDGEFMLYQEVDMRAVGCNSSVC
jgi:hypothetical protein